MDPPVRWRGAVPSEIFLSQLHDVIQTAMGWNVTRLYLFESHEVTAMDSRSDRSGRVVLAVPVADRCLPRHTSRRARGRGSFGGTFLIIRPARPAQVRTTVYITYWKTGFW